MYCYDSTFPAVARTQKSTMWKCRIKLYGRKNLWVEHAAKSRRATEPPEALDKVVFSELKNGKKLRMLQKDAGSPAPAGANRGK